MSTTKPALWSALAIACVTICGCGQASSPPTTPTPASPVAEAGHEHGGWWCAEHGVPEEVCALCNRKVADQFKAKGDWCRLHDCPDSQCFVCHPDREAEYVALYEAKYGSKPPKRE